MKIFLFSEGQVRGSEMWSSQIRSRFLKVFLFSEDQVRSDQVKICQDFPFLKIKSRFAKIFPFFEDYFKILKDFPIYGGYCNLNVQVRSG